MRREIVFEVDGSVVDLYTDTSLTLNFNSSILGDIGSIKCNVSQTITLPRTVTNDRVFDLALLPGYESVKTHRILPCRMYVDGVAIFDNGQCHLLDSSGGEYEIAVTWGVLHQYSDWLEDKPKLRDLDNSAADSIPWNEGWGVNVIQGGVSDISDASMYAFDYDCGVSDKKLVNIHPSVTLQEIWHRVMEENALDIDAGAAYEDMRNYAVVLKNNNTSLQTLKRQLVIQEKPYYIAPGLEEDEKKILLNVLDSDFFNVQTSSFVHNGYRKVSVNIGEIYLSLPVVAGVGEGGADFKTSALASPYDYALVIKPYNQSVIVVNPSSTLYDNTVVYRVDRTIEVEMSEEDNGKDAVQIYIRLKKWESLTRLIWVYPNLTAAEIVEATGNYGADFGGWTVSLRDALKLSRGSGSLSYVSYTYENNSNDYPLADFRLAPNLPDISQIDFVNFICSFYGLFPVQKGNAVELVRFDVLGDNIDNGNFLDWSGKLVETHSDAPQTMAFTLGSYARNNAVRYKEDKNDPIDITAYIKVDDESLEWEKKLIEFPFAASHGDKIPQYSLGEDGSVVKNDCEYRLMQIGWDDMTLSFVKSMNPQQMINRNYQTLQDVIRKPKVIEEEMTLSLIDLQELDYTKPVYLAKYGRFFAVMSVQWDSGALTSNVKLLMIR